MRRSIPSLQCQVLRLRLLRRRHRTCDDVVRAQIGGHFGAATAAQIGGMPPVRVRRCQAGARSPWNPRRGITERAKAEGDVDPFGNELLPLIVD